jgi:hypothetical protein
MDVSPESSNVLVSLSDFANPAMDRYLKQWSWRVDPGWVSELFFLGIRWLTEEADVLIRMPLSFSGLYRNLTGLLN